jgi:hypothetical protein
MCMWLTTESQQIAKLPPQFIGYKNGFYIRGTVIRMISMPMIESDIESLSELCQVKWNDLDFFVSVIIVLIDRWIEVFHLWKLIL